MFIKLAVEKLQKEWGVIKKAPISFGIAWACGTVVSFLILYGMFGAALSVRSSTVQAYRDRFGDLTSAKSKQLFQIVSFTSDPNTEKLTPQEPDLPALAYATN